MKLGILLMPSHPPELSIGDGQQRDLDDLERLDALGFEEAWIGEHFTASWEPCPAPDLLIAQALLRTKRIRLGPLAQSMKNTIRFFFAFLLVLGLAGVVHADDDKDFFDRTFDTSRGP